MTPLTPTSGLRFVPLEWDGGKWIPRPCPFTDAHLAEIEEYLRKHRTLLPVPKRALRDIVLFDWLANTLPWRGEVQKIELSIHPNYEPYIYYTVLANGHTRWVRESRILGG
jgi:hypothetical protein